MTQYLLFRLFGHLTAWGDVAVGEFRPVYSVPSRSGVIGLVAGACGITRTDQRLWAFHDSFGFACRIDAPGRRMRDYHTTQTVPAPAFSAFQKAHGRAARNRAEIMAFAGKNALNTVLSTRELMTDQVAVACLWSHENALLSLSQVKEALRRPCFLPYLGRKACPPALPFGPVLADAPDPVSALLDNRLSGEEFIRPLLKEDRHVTLLWEGPSTRITALQQRVRRDSFGCPDPQTGGFERIFSERIENLAVVEVGNASMSC